LGKILVAQLEGWTEKNLSEPERRILMILYSFKGGTNESVYPGIGVIADMAGYADKTRISKITKSLESKGWITKKRRGFTGGNSYTLSVPVAKLASETNLEQEANAKLASETNTNLDSEAKYKEQTNELTIEQTNIITQEVSEVESEKPEKQKKQKLDYSVWPQMPSEQTLADWVVMRKRIKADVSQTVINSFGKELALAARGGFTTDYCLTECVTRNWRGFKFEWILNQQARGGQGAGYQQPNGAGSRQKTVSHADRVRADARHAIAAIDAQAGFAPVYEDGGFVREQGGEPGLDHLF